jgi:hypothetical protein
MASSPTKQRKMDDDAEFMASVTKEVEDMRNEKTIEFKENEMGELRRHAFRKEKELIAQSQPCTLTRRPGQPKHHPPGLRRC